MSPKGGEDFSGVIIAAIHTDITELIRFYSGVIRLVGNQIVISRKELMETHQSSSKSKVKSFCLTHHKVCRHVCSACISAPCTCRPKGFTDALL